MYTNYIQTILRFLFKEHSFDETTVAEADRVYIQKFYFWRMVQPLVGFVWGGTLLPAVMMFDSGPSVAGVVGFYVLMFGVFLFVVCNAYGRYMAERNIRFAVLAFKIPALYLLLLVVSVVVVISIFWKPTHGGLSMGEV